MFSDESLCLKSDASYNSSPILILNLGMENNDYVSLAILLGCFGSWLECEKAFLPLDFMILYDIGFICSNLR